MSILSSPKVAAYGLSQLVIFFFITIFKTTSKIRKRISWQLASQAVIKLLLAIDTGSWVPHVGVSSPTSL